VLQLIDFGRVSVGSVSAKNFSVANDLTQSVMVKVEELDVELQQSKHLCQIIPQVGVWKSALCAVAIVLCFRTVRSALLHLCSHPQRFVRW
jgi:hypothetical protein